MKCNCGNKANPKYTEPADESLSRYIPTYYCNSCKKEEDAISRGRPKLNLVAFGWILANDDCCNNKVECCYIIGKSGCLNYSCYGCAEYACK